MGVAGGRCQGLTLFRSFPCLSLYPSYPSFLTLNPSLVSPLLLSPCSPPHVTLNPLLFISPLPCSSSPRPRPSRYRMLSGCCCRALRLELQLQVAHLLHPLSRASHLCDGEDAKEVSRAPFLYAQPSMITQCTRTWLSEGLLIESTSPFSASPCPMLILPRLSLLSPRTFLATFCLPLPIPDFASPFPACPRPSLALTRLLLTSTHPSLTPPRPRPPPLNPS